MSDEEYERFEITDYDLENEFGGVRKRQSKNQQIYGIWADKESDDDDDERPSFTSGRHSKSYTAPIGFIAGGVQQAGKPEEMREKDAAESDDEETSHSGRQLLGAGSSSSEDEKIPSRSGFGRETMVESEIAGFRKKGYRPTNTILAQRGMGTWEKHTKGIGTKLLLQMGYQPGKGLGKDLQGIEAPIEAKLRKGRGAIGAYGTESHQKVMTKPEAIKEAKREGKDKFGGPQWKKTDSGSKNRGSKYIYKTVEDVLNQGDQPSRRREFSELTKVKVIDMTGREQRVLSGYHAISGVQKPVDLWDQDELKQFSNFSLPELLHNLNILVDMCEQDILTNAKTIKYSEDRLIALEVEMSKLQKVMDDEDKVADNLETLINKLEKLMEGGENHTLSAEEIADQFEDLKRKYLTEFMMHDISGSAPCILKEPMKEFLESWDPLVDPEGPVPLFQRWKRILECELGRIPQTPMHDPYYRLIWQSWMPRIREIIMLWDCKAQCDSMVTMVREWKALLPPWILENLLNQLLMPKIKLAVDDWNPLLDTVPIHSWTQPWIPLIGTEYSQAIFPMIRQKLSRALVAWHPSDSSARFMLLPWLNVFSHHEMESFLITNILPKLAVCLQEVDPQQQSTDGWCWVMSWHQLLGDNLLADLLDKSFFPKWLQVLTLWLNMAPNFDQISGWYQGWKGLLPESVREHPAIRGHLNNALELMSRSVGGPTLAPPPPPPPPPQISALSSRYQQGLVESVRTANQMVEGFKDLVSKRCEENGIVFVPLPNRYHEGKQVYRCGTLQIYLDRNVIFYSDNGGASWIPISLPVLLKRAVPM